MQNYDFKTYNELFKHITADENPTFLNYLQNGKYESLSIDDFNKSIVPNSKYEQLNKLFCYNENKGIEGFTTACIPFYNDILVFK